MASVIKSIQQFSITIGVLATTNTATITAVTAANAMIIYGGMTSTTTALSVYVEVFTGLTLTNGTTVTATRGIGTAGALTIQGTVVEFASDVNSIQYGTISIAATALSNTSTLGTTVGSNAFVIFLGEAVTGTATNNFTQYTAGVTLTNSTTVTANVGTVVPSGTTVTVYYCVVDLDSTIIASIQQRTFTSTSGSLSYTDTITSASTTASLIIWGGHTFATGAGSIQASNHYVQMTNATTTTFTGGSTAGTSRTHYYTVVTFQSAVLNGSIRRGTAAMAAASSGSSSLGTTVTPAVSFANWNNYDSTSSTPATVMPTLALDSGGAKVNVALNTAGTTTVGWEVIQFTAGGGTTNGVGTVSGVAIVAGIGRSLYAAVGTVSGTATVAAIGRGSHAAIGTVSGAATVAGHAAGTAAAIGAVTGHATVTGHSASTFSAVGTVTGHATVIGDAPVTVSAVGTVNASCIVQAQDSNIPPGGLLPPGFVSMLTLGFTMARQH